MIVSNRRIATFLRNLKVAYDERPLSHYWLLTLHGDDGRP